jgi:hypothetical protein
MSVINIKIENFGDMFWFTEPLPGQIQNTVLVLSVSAHTRGSHTVYKLFLHQRSCLILNTLANIIKHDV